MRLANLADPAALAQAADENFVVHATWTLRHWVGTVWRPEPDLVIADSGLPCDTFNFICRARLPAATADSRIAAAIGHFRSVGRPFSWWVGPADLPSDLPRRLGAAGLEEAEGELAMAADLTTLTSGSVGVPGLEVRRVRNRTELATYAELSAANWSPPDAQVLRFYQLAAPALLGGESPQRLYLGYWRGDPVATAELTLAGSASELVSGPNLVVYCARG